MVETVEIHGGVRYNVRHNCEPLGQMYDRLNRKWWSNSLPKYTVAFEGEEDTPPMDGDTLGQVFHDRKLIVLSHVRSIVRLGFDGVEEVLKHEMSHLGSGDDGHGPAFQAELKRVSR